MKFLILIISIITILTDPVLIKNEWIRNSTKGTNTACFMDIINNSTKNDTLIKVSSKIAEITEIHETFTEGDKMGMRKINFLVIPAKTTLSLKPRHHHIMLINLLKDLKVGNVEKISLQFSSGKKIELEVPVKSMIKNK